MNLTLDKLQEVSKIVNNTLKPLDVIESHGLCKTKQVRFPSSKKRRICKKWAKNHRNWITYPDPDYYRSGNQIFCHPITASKLRQELKQSVDEAFVSMLTESIIPFAG